VLFSAQILPPWDSIMFFDMNKPKPLPPVPDVTANFENRFGNTSGSIPVPVSFILTMTSPLLLSLSLLLLLPSLESIIPAFLSILIVTSPSLANRIALKRMLEITWIILPLSASTIIISSPSSAPSSPLTPKNAHLLFFHYNDHFG
jgi:hypothetical protein